MVSFRKQCGFILFVSMVLGLSLQYVAGRASGRTETLVRPGAEAEPASVGSPPDQRRAIPGVREFPLERSAGGDGGVDLDSTKPNLFFYKPTGWPSKVIVSKETDTSVNDTSILSSDPLYIDFAFANDGGYSGQSAIFLVYLYLDDELIAAGAIEFSMHPWFYGAILDYEIDPVPAGRHKIRVELDPDNSLAELDETDNFAEKYFVVTQANTAPVVEAGPDQTVRPGTLVRLAGTATDPQGDALTLAWSQTAGVSIGLENANSQEAQFQAPAVGASSVLTFKFEASDGALKASDTVNVTVDPLYNRPPTAEAGPDQAGKAGDQFQLSGTGVDPDSDPLVFTWTQVAGTASVPSVELIQDGAGPVSFIAPVWAKDYQLELRLSVTDTLGATSQDTARVSVESKLPNQVIAPYSLVKPPAGPGPASEDLFENTYVGMVLANPNQLPQESVAIEARTSAGDSAVAMETEIAANGQMAKLSTEISSDAAAASLAAQGEQLPLQGLFLIGDMTQSRLDGIGGRLIEAESLRFLIAGTAPGESIVVFLFNGDFDAAEDVQLTYFGSDGAQIAATSVTIAPKGTLQASLSELFPGVEQPLEGYLAVESPVPLRGFELIATGQTFSALSAQSPQAVLKLSAPHFFTAPNGGSVLRLLNAETEPVVVSVQAFDDSGVKIAEKWIELPASGMLVEDLAGMLALESLDSILTGYLEVVPRNGLWEVAKKLAGSLTFSSGSYQSTLPMIAEPSRKMLFLHVAQSTAFRVFTGLAVQNPNSQETVVKLTVYLPDGRTAGTEEFTVAPGRRTVGLLNNEQFMGPEFEQVGGHIRLESSLAVYSFALFGGVTQEYLSAIEGQTPLLEAGLLEVNRSTCYGNPGPEFVLIEPDPRLGVQSLLEGEQAAFSLNFRDDSTFIVVGSGTVVGVKSATWDLEPLQSQGITAQPWFEKGPHPEDGRTGLQFQVPEGVSGDFVLSVTVADVRSCKTTVRFGFRLGE